LQGRPRYPAEYTNRRDKYLRRSSGTAWSAGKFLLAAIRDHIASAYEALVYEGE